MMNNKWILAGLTILIAVGSAHLAHAEELMLPTLSAHGSTLALVFCGFIALVKARSDMH
ncbi:MAG TPA: hypothetical protein VLC91_15705 [Spongiibacteraceae bacterium]|nr:hypothetical protein [Spongiibacteraceae bacterium]